VEQQRVVNPLDETDHFADQDGVIAAVIARPGAAFEDRRELGEERRARQAGLVRHLGELVGGAAGETQREILVIGAEEVDGEAVGGNERVVARRRLGGAPQHQWRIERHRGEGIRRHADPLAAAVRSDDGDPGRKLAQRLAKGQRIETGGADVQVGCHLRSSQCPQVVNALNVKKFLFI
jgi:hypothetical protein